MVPLFISGFFAIAVAVFLATSLVRTLRRHPAPTLLSYLFYILLWHALILYMLVFLFSPLFLPKRAQGGYLLLNSIFVVPFHGLITFFFTDFTWNWLGMRLRWVLKPAIGVPFLAIFLYYSSWVIEELPKEPTEGTLVITSPLSGPLMLMLITGILLFSLYKSRKIADPIKSRNVLFFSLSTLGGFAMLPLFFSGVINFGDVCWENGLTALVFSAINVPGCYFLRMSFSLERPPRPAAELAQADLSVLAARYKITPREREIITLVIAGKKNREIEKALFISPDTVKKHIYNAYRKMGIKNRVQLIHAVLELTRKGEDEPNKRLDW